MTYEYAAYFKLLLLCGYKDELLRYIDNALIEQDPISDRILDLSAAAADDKKLLCVLNEILRQAKDADIEWNQSVFELVMSFLKKEYIHNGMTMKHAADLMNKIAGYIGRYDVEPWETMYLLGCLFDEAEAGYIDTKDYKRKFESFINDNICWSDYPDAVPKKRLFKRKKTKHNVKSPSIALPLTNIQEVGDAGILYIDAEGKPANINYFDAYKCWCKSKNVKKSKPKYICDRTKSDGWKLIFYTNPQITFYADPSEEELWIEILNKITQHGYPSFDWD